MFLLLFLFNIGLEALPNAIGQNRTIKKMNAMIEMKETTMIIYG